MGKKKIKIELKSIDILEYCKTFSIMKKTQSYCEKKIREKIVADFFINRFNQYHKKNYKIQVNENENIKDGDIDAYAVSDECKTLFLQIKTNEPELEGFFGRARKHGGTRFGNISVNIKEAILKKIKDGENQYPSTKCNLIFIISERISPVTFDKEYAQLISKWCSESKFKGIYLVKLPIGYDGQVVAIKDIYGNNGEVF